MFVLKGKYTKSYPYLRPLGQFGNIRLNISSIPSFARNSLRVLLGRGEQRISSISSFAKNSSISGPPPLPPALWPDWEHLTQHFFAFFVCVKFFASSSRTQRKTHFVDVFISEEFFDFWTPTPHTRPLAGLGALSIYWSRTPPQTLATNHQHQRAIFGIKILCFLEKNVKKIEYTMLHHDFSELFKKSNLQLKI